MTDSHDDGDSVLLDDGAGSSDESSPAESRFKVSFLPDALIRFCHTIRKPGNGIAVIISLMMAVVLLGGSWIFYRDHIKKRSTLPGSEDYNAMMAMPMPPEEKPFFVYVSERRNVVKVSPDFYALFPGLPVDSMAVSLLPGDGGDVGFSSAAYCLDWKALGGSVRKKMISVQRGRSQDLSFLFDSPGVEAKPLEAIDDIPIFSLKPSKLGNIMFSMYGNALLLSRSREDMILSLKALMHAMTRLSWNEGPLRVVRTFIEDDRRYRFFLYPEDGDTAGLGLPRRIRQALPQSVLFDMAVQRVDCDRSTEKFFLWLTRKEEMSSDDAGFASDSISIRSCAGDVPVLRRKS